MAISGNTTTASVADQATVATLLAANAARVGASVYNDSSSNLYLKAGATATTTDFTVLLLGNGSGVGGYWEAPYGYTGIITGIWASDSTGSARTTEYT
jgi:hypothetical protein